MIPISTTYRKNGYNFSQVSRTGDVAVYAQVDPDSGKAVAYEVFIVQKRKEFTIAGNTIPAKEGCPSNEQWGAEGYTVHTIPQATVKEAILQKRVDDRKNAAT